MLAGNVCGCFLTSLLTKILQRQTEREILRNSGRPGFLEESGGKYSVMAPGLFSTGPKSLRRYPIPLQLWVALGSSTGVTSGSAKLGSIMTKEFLRNINDSKDL